MSQIENSALLNEIINVEELEQKTAPSGQTVDACRRPSGDVRRKGCRSLPPIKMGGPIRRVAA